MQPHAERLSRDDIDRLAEEIAELSAHIDAASHRLLSLIRRFDAQSGWHQQGALTCAHWLSWRIGLDIGAAREHVRVARALASLPAIDEALRLGQVSYSKVRALTRVAAPSSEATLLHWARSATGSQLERICRKYRSVRRREVLSLEDEAWIRFVRVRDTDSGMVRIEAQLPPEEAAVVLKALEVAARRAEGVDDVPAGTPDPKQIHGCQADPGGISRSEPGDDAASQHTSRASTSADVPAGTLRLSTPKARLRRADALVALAETYLGGQAGAQSHTPPVEIVVHVEQEAEGRELADGSASLDDGTPISARTATRLLCDASIVRVVEDQHGTPLDVGRRTRTIPSALKRALRLRDRGCRFPTCSHRRVDGHHLVPWSEGGATRLDNLCLLCRSHHRFVHEHGYRIERGDGNELVFLDPKGRVVPHVPAPLALEIDGESFIRRENAEAGIAIDARTSLPNWDGRPADYHLAVQILCQRQARAASTS